MQLNLLKNSLLLCTALLFFLSPTSFASSPTLAFKQNNINVPVNVVSVPKHSLLITQDRVNNVVKKINKDATVWNLLTTRISNYYKKAPFNAGEYAAAFVLAYYISGEKIYINRAIELINQTYFSEENIGWKYYKGRNQFRSNARWAVMGYSWIKKHISVSERKRIESILMLWATHWLNYVDSENNFGKLVLADTDEITSLTHNLTLLGTVLADSKEHKDFGHSVLIVSDKMLQRFVIDYYMKDIMRGGAWAEGSDYSPNTQRHWIETFLINKEQRGLSFPLNYAQQAAHALVHQTLAGGTGIYKYGSEENATDYDLLSGDYRYDFALSLMAILSHDNDLLLINDWFSRLIQKEGFKKGSMVTHFQRLLFHEPNTLPQPTTPKLPTFNYAQGIGLVSSRSSWENDATNLFFINRESRVDHEHKDALSFDIAHAGEWITKEATGYGGVSQSSIAHNTILIENVDNGSSNPTSRPAGEPFYHNLYDDKYVTLISADATNTYNMKGYFSTHYTSLVNRQLAFIKPNIALVYDHVITDNTQIKDLVHYKKLPAGVAHNRWVKIIQHVQQKPTKIDETNNSYLINNKNTSLVYQVISPDNPNVKIVNEKELWKSYLQYQVPDNQRKWHFEISKKETTQNNEFITTLHFSDNKKNVADLLLKPISLTAHNGYILSGNVRGLAIESHSKKYIILFNRNPNNKTLNVKIKKPRGFESALVYGVGFKVNE